MRDTGALVSLLALALLLLQGCASFDASEHNARPDDVCVLEGSLTTSIDRQGTWIVAALEHSAIRGGIPPAPVDHMLVQSGDPWTFELEPGRFSVLAFRDVDGDRVLEAGEPFHHVGTDSPLNCARGDRLAGIALAPDAASVVAVPPGVSVSARVRARALDSRWARGLRDVTAFGEVVPLSDARFASGVANRGTWRPNDFLAAGHAGVYLTEPHDPERIPVLFIHGIGGSPRVFADLAAGLDRERFQPWFYYYPSGVRLSRAAELLAQTLREIEARHESRRMHIVAHSMGGLVGQAYLARSANVSASPDVGAFVAIATPWSGHAAAQDGLDRSPVVLPVWRDLAPSSDFLERLFDQQPSIARAGTELHLLFGYRGAGGTDGVIALSSMLRGEALQHAQSVRAFDNTHAGILRDDDAIAAVRQLLERAVEARDGRAEVAE